MKILQMISRTESADEPCFIKENMLQSSSTIHRSGTYLRVNAYVHIIEDHLIFIYLYQSAMIILSVANQMWNLAVYLPATCWRQ